MEADEIIARYGLVPHPEGGHYRETFRAVAEDGSRGAATAIYYLPKAGETSPGTASMPRRSGNIAQALRFT